MRFKFMQDFTLWWFSLLFFDRKKPLQNFTVAAWFFVSVDKWHWYFNERT